MLMNILAVLAALVWSFVVGFIWYGPIFGKKWAEYTKIKQNDKVMKANMKKYILQNQVFSLMWIITLSYMIYFGNPVYIDQVIVLVVLGWLAFSVPAVMAPNIWEKKPLWLGMINIFASLSSLLVAGIILFLIIG